MLQYKLVKIDKFGWWDLEIILADAGTQIYLHRFQGKMINPQCSFDVSSSRISLNEHTG